MNRMIFTHKQTKKPKSKQQQQKRKKQFIKEKHPNGCNYEENSLKPELEGTGLEPTQMYADDSGEHSSLVMVKDHVKM